MSKINLTSIILTAQKKLIEKPFDLAHDISHHYRVYEFGLNKQSKTVLLRKGNILNI